MWKKKFEAARAAWEAAMKAAKVCASELEAKEERGTETTAEERARLDQLIESVKTAKAEYDRMRPLAEFEQEQETLDATAARKTRDNLAPGILTSGSRGSASRPLKVSNIFKATFAAGSSHNQAIFKEYAYEEYSMSERLKGLGYSSESMGGWLFPLGHELIVEPVYESEQKRAAFDELRREIKERLQTTVDPGELGWLVKRHPSLASDLGLEYKDLALGDDTLGGYLVPTAQANRVVDLLRNRSVMMRAGASEFALPPSGNLTLPRLNSDPSFAYTDPDTTTDMSTSNLGTGVVRLQAKSLRGAVTIPNDLIRYSSPSVELLVRSALASRAAVAEDLAFLESAGSSIAPKGLLNYPLSVAETPAINKLTLHVAGPGSEANGDTFIPEDVAKIIGLYYAGNDDDQPTGWIMRPMMWSAIQNRRADAVTAGDQKGPFMFWTDRGTNRTEIPQALGGFPVFPSQQVNKTRAEGSSSTLTYILFGNFRRMLVGRSGVIELAVSEHVKFLQDKTIIRAILRSDMSLEHEESFVLTDTVLES